MKKSISSLAEIKLGYRDILKAILKKADADISQEKIKQVVETDLKEAAAIFGHESGLDGVFDELATHLAEAVMVIKNPPPKETYSPEQKLEIAYVDKRNLKDFFCAANNTPACIASHRGNFLATQPYALVDHMSHYFQIRDPKTKQSKGLMITKFALRSNNDGDPIPVILTHQLYTDKQTGNSGVALRVMDPLCDYFAQLGFQEIHMTDNGYGACYPVALEEGWKKTTGSLMALMSFKSRGVQGIYGDPPQYLNEGKWVAARHYSKVLIQAPADVV